MYKNAAVIAKKDTIKYGKMTKNIKNIRILYHFIKESVRTIVGGFLVLKEEIDMRIAICDDEIICVKADKQYY